MQTADNARIARKWRVMTLTAEQCGYASEYSLQGNGHILPSALPGLCRYSIRCAMNSITGYTFWKPVTSWKLVYRLTSYQITKVQSNVKKSRFPWIHDFWLALLISNEILQKQKSVRLTAAPVFCANRSFAASALVLSFLNRSSSFNKATRVLDFSRTFCPWSLPSSLYWKSLSVWMVNRFSRHCWATRSLPVFSR